jgi:hypothetical protein
MSGSMVQQKVRHSLPPRDSIPPTDQADNPFSAFRGRCVEDTCRTTGPVSIQITEHWIHEQDLSSKHRRTVRSSGCAPMRLYT